MKFTQKKFLLRFAGILVALLLVSCATPGIGPAQQSISNVEVLINQAKQREAEKYAPLELKLAEEKLQEAKKALDEEEVETASRKAEEAMMDARLAGQKAETAKAKEQAENKAQDVETLQNEMERVQKTN